MRSAAGRRPSWPPAISTVRTDAEFAIARDDGLRYNSREAVRLVLFVVVVFIFIRISGRRRGAHDHEGTSSLLSAVANQRYVRLTEGERPQRRASHGTADGVCGQDIGELVDTIGGEPLEVIEFQDVDALLDEQIDVDRVEAAANGLRVGRLRRHIFEPGRIGTDHKRALLLDEPLRGCQADARRVVLADLGMVAAVLAPVARGSRAHRTTVPGVTSTFCALNAPSMSATVIS